MTPVEKGGASQFATPKRTNYVESFSFTTLSSSGSPALTGAGGPVHNSSSGQYSQLSETVMVIVSVMQISSPFTGNSSKLFTLCVIIPQRYYSQRYYSLALLFPALLFPSVIISQRYHSQRYYSPASLFLRDIIP